MPWVRGLSLVGAVALVVGNMVGTSIYTLPASLATATGPLSMVAWLLTAGGYLFVALVYASLGMRYARTGGPYVYAREAFGDLAGFQAVWAYWVSAVVGNAAIVTSVVGYAAGFSPALAASTTAQFVLAQALMWGLTAVNILGVRAGARLQIALVLIHIVPLVVFTAVALAAFDVANLTPFAPRGPGSVLTGVALVVWAYSGVESATVPAEEVKRAEQTIPRGTMLGYALGTVVFLAVSAAVTGALPNDVIASSPRPIALLVERTAGGWAGTLVGLTAIVAGAGTLNGWILMAGRIPVAAARDGLFFRRLGELHPRRGTPHVALLVSTSISSAILLLYFSRTLLAVFDFIVLLAVLLTLLPHLYAAAAEMLLARRDPERYPPAARRRARVVAPLAFVFILACMAGVGPEAALWGFVAIFAGMPLYVVFVTGRSRLPPEN